MNTPWEHPQLHAHAHLPKVYVHNVPPFSMLHWAHPDVFLVHPGECWDHASLAAWVQRYENLGVQPRRSPPLCLNEWLYRAHAYPQDPLSRRFFKALWLGVWTGLPRLWFHPQWAEVSPALQADWLQWHQELCGIQAVMMCPEVGAQKLVWINDA